MKISKTACLVLSLALLCACSPRESTPSPEVSAPPEVSSPTETSPQSEAAPREDQIVFTRESFPRMNGSTSMVPLGEAVASVLLGESRESVSDLVRFSKTSMSYLSLMYGEADILLAARPSEETFRMLAEDGFGYETGVLATDALVFVVNEKNPVDSLTSEQVRSIYTGEITNWSEVGGDNVPIIPFQRNAGAGSQAAMLEAVMKDTPMMTPPEDYVIAEMSGLMQAVKSFDGSEGAIGYSMYYYAEDMKMAEGLKILAIDGVAPNPESIREEKYPFPAPYFVVIAADAPEQSAQRLLFNWLLSEEGQRLVKSQGYVSAQDVQ